MAIHVDSSRPGELSSREGLAVIDCDVHNQTFPPDPKLCQYLSRRWREHIGLVGIRTIGGSTQIPQQRANAARLDSIPPNGGGAGSDPDFAREQLLDEYDLTAAILNGFGGLGTAATGNTPIPLLLELTRAYNQWCHDFWLGADPRWYASINVAYEQPLEAVKEIERCRALSDRFVQVLLCSRSEHPIGNPKYWPIFEAAAHYDLPVAFHVGVARTSRLTASGMPNYYFEDHVGFAQQNFSLVPSLIFEGVFEQFPTLKIALVEMGWSWVMPLAWRMDASWRVLRHEVPHLTREPSAYLREHFWFTSQPIEEPPHPEWFDDVHGQFDRLGLGDRLMFSSDYPHWDFDSPDEALPAWLPREVKQKIFSTNASSLYGIHVDDEGA